MNLEWIQSPLAMFSALSACVGGCVMIVFIQQTVLQRVAKYEKARQELRDKVDELAASLQALTREMEDRGNGAAVAFRSNAINMNQRAEAMRMCRRGLDTHTISAMLNSPRAEAELLQTVHVIMSQQAEQGSASALASNLSRV
jgi:hypothetical protein